jgi:hypothetical protein
MLSDKTVPRLSIDPFSDGFLAEPYAHHALLRDAGPVFWLECYGIYGAARHAHSHRTRCRVHVCLAGRTAPTVVSRQAQADQALNRRNQIAQTMGRKIGPLIDINPATFDATILRTLQHTPRNRCA